MQRLAAYEALMRASPDQQISLTDPDSRSTQMAAHYRALSVEHQEIKPEPESAH